MTGLAYADSLNYGFLADARFLIQDNHYLDRLSYFWGNLTNDYFWSSSGARIGYWRPFTKVSWLFEAQIFGNWAGGFHLVGLGWFLLGVGGVQVMARRLGIRPALAMTAGLLYGLNPAVVEPVCLIMARSDVVSTTCIIWSLAGWLAWRKEGRKRWILLHVVAFIVALGSKEAAIITTLLPLLWLIMDGALSKGRRRELIQAIPLWTVAIVYLLLRSLVMSQHETPGLALDPLRIFAGGGNYFQGLLPFRFSSGIRNISYAEAGSLSEVALNLLAWLGAGLLAFLSIRQNKVKGTVLFFWALASLGLVLVVKKIAVPGIAGKFPLADRWMMQAVAAVTLLYVSFMEQIKIRWLLKALQIAVALWAMGLLILSPTSHGYYASEEDLLKLEQKQYLEIPEAFRTKNDICRAASRKIIGYQIEGATEKVLALSKKLPGYCQKEGLQQYNIFSTLVKDGRFKEARPLMRDLLAKLGPRSRFRPSVLYLSGITMAGLGRNIEARKLFQRALSLGFSNCKIFIRMARLNITMRQPALAASRFEEAANCLNKSSQGTYNNLRTAKRTVPAILLTAGFWHSRAGHAAHAQRILNRLEKQFRLNHGHKQAAAKLKRIINGLKNKRKGPSK